MRTPLGRSRLNLRLTEARAELRRAVNIHDGLIPTLQAANTERILSLTALIRDGEKMLRTHDAAVCEAELLAGGRS